MAKTHQELEAIFHEARSRMLSGTIDGEQYNTVSRLDVLEKSLNQLGESADSELYRHFPVAAVAVLESHFKLTVAAIVNAGSPYLERGLALVKDRLKSTAVDFLPILHRKSVTVGELVAHSLPFNALSSLETALGPLLGGALKDFVCDSIFLWDQRHEFGEKRLLVNDVNALWKSLSTTIERRHILAHEAATNYEVTFAQARESVACVKEFTSSMDSVMWATVWKDEPLTQYEMNVKAWATYASTRKSLCASLREARVIAAEDGDLQKFNALHVQWKKASVAWTNWEEAEFMGGSIRPMIAAMARNNARAERLKEVDHWIQRQRPEGRQRLQRPE